MLHQIEASENLRTIPVVVLSTSAAGAHKRRALELGARYYVTKPHSFDLFLEEITAICTKLFPEQRRLTRSRERRTARIAPPYSSQGGAWTRQERRSCVKLVTSHKRPDRALRLLQNDGLML